MFFPWNSDLRRSMNKFDFLSITIGDSFTRRVTIQQSGVVGLTRVGPGKLRVRFSARNESKIYNVSRLCHGWNIPKIINGAISPSLLCRDTRIWAWDPLFPKSNKGFPMHRWLNYGFFPGTLACSKYFNLLSNGFNNLKLTLTTLQSLQVCNYLDLEIEREKPRYTCSYNIIPCANEEGQPVFLVPPRIKMENFMSEILRVKTILPENDVLLVRIIQTMHEMHRTEWTNLW